MDVVIALIGCGIWGRKVLRDLRSLDVTVVVVDPSAGNRERAIAEGAREAHATLDPVGRVDGIVVASPAVTHVETIGAALEQVVANERRMAVDDSVRGKADEMLSALAYGRHHPHGWPGYALGGLPRPDPEQSRPAVM